MCAIEIEWIDHFQYGLCPRQRFAGFVRFIGIARWFRWRFIAKNRKIHFKLHSTWHTAFAVRSLPEYAWRLFATTCCTRFRCITSIGNWRYFSPWLNRIRTTHWNENKRIEQMWKECSGREWDMLSSGIYLQSDSMSFPSFVPRLNFSDLRLNEPPVGAVVVPRRNRNGRTLAMGRLCCNADQWAKREFKWSLLQ